MTKSLINFLDSASAAYYSGNPIISDNQFDYLAELIQYNKVGARVLSKTAKHAIPLLSLQKFYPGEGKAPLAEYTKQKITTPKLDGAAVSHYYIEGQLVQSLTRGDGIEGQIITDKMLLSCIVGSTIDYTLPLQITGEIVASKDIPNSRNYASGALNLNDLNEFSSRELYFVAYDCSAEFEYYSQKLEFLRSLGFKTVADEEFCANFPHDGIVTRVNLEKDYAELGSTSKHPRGAYATKSRSSGLRTTLREVIWQTGKSGKITPVAIFDPICIDGANITRATLNNPGYIRALNLDIGDFLYIERAGNIIPCVLRSEKNDLEYVEL